MKVNRFTNFKSLIFACVALLVILGICALVYTNYYKDMTQKDIYSRQDAVLSNINVTGIPNEMNTLLRSLRVGRTGEKDVLNIIGNYDVYGMHGEGITKYYKNSKGDTVGSFTYNTQDGKLSNSKLKFDLNLPTVDEIKTQLGESALSTDDNLYYNEYGLVVYTEANYVKSIELVMPKD